MPNQSYTLQLDGVVSLDRFMEAIEGWKTAIDQFTSEVGRDHISRIIIENLSGGSALVEALFEFNADTSAAQFTTSYNQFARGISGTNILTFPNDLQRAAQKIRRAAGMDSGEGIVLGSESEDVFVQPNLEPEIVGETMFSPVDATRRSASVEAFGSVVGTLHGLNSRSGLKAVVYDTVFDKGVKIALTDKLRSELGLLWDKQVTVSGLIRRSSTDGHPLSISRVSTIVISPIRHQGYEWRKARGVIKGLPSESKSEDLIRQARNA